MLAAECLNQPCAYREKNLKMVLASQVAKREDDRVIFPENLVSATQWGGFVPAPCCYGIVTVLLRLEE
jgi:hypothetical protein